jgi:hypothetical protein
MAARHRIHRFEQVAHALYGFRALQHTSSGLSEDTHTKPQLPSATVTRTPSMVTRSRIGCPATFSAFFRKSQRWRNSWATSEKRPATTFGGVEGDP